MAWYIVAGLLEIFGIATVAIEIRSGRRRAAAFLARSSNSDATSWDQLEGLAPAVAELMAGSKWQVIGVSFLLLGVVVSTATNIWVTVR